MQPTVLIAGRKGQIARALADTPGAARFRLVALGRPDLDILSAASIETALERIRPDIVINTAAYTSVDQAEVEADTAFALNAAAAASLASAAARRSIPVIHFSTDYVFDGTKDSPYQEPDTPRPLGVYGASKLAGEQGVAQANRDHLILRTAWVYSPFGRNFVRTMLTLASLQDEVSVVDDQIGTPTSASDIAAATLSLAASILSGERALEPGIFHLAGSGEASWAGLAEAIFSKSAMMGGPAARVIRVRTSQRPAPAQRPPNSRLDSSRVRTAYGITLPAWQESLHTCLQRLIKTGAWAQ